MNRKSTSPLFAVNPETQEPELIPDLPKEEVKKEQRFIITLNRPTIVVYGKQYRRSQICKGTGISMSMISKIFSGKRMPNLQNALRLAAFFHITVEELVAFIIPTAARKSDEQIEQMRNEIVNGDRSLRQTYQGLVTGSPIKDKLVLERAVTGIQTDSITGEQ